MAAQVYFQYFSFHLLQTSPEHLLPPALCFPSDLANGISFNPKIHYIPPHCITLYKSIFMWTHFTDGFYLHISCRLNVHINITQT